MRKLNERHVSLAACVALPVAVLSAAALQTATPSAHEPSDDVDYVADVRFALDEIDKHCSHFFGPKEIEWKRVRKEFMKEAKAVETHQEHLVLLVRLLARLKDGHAAVQPLEGGRDVTWPEMPEQTGPGMFLCRNGKKIYVKNSWNGAAANGIKPGMEVVKIDGEKVNDWLETRVETMCDTRSFSTPQQAFYYTCHWGLADEVGTRWKLELIDSEGKKRKRTITHTKANPVAWGPVFAPEGLEGTKDVSYGTTANGWGYVHLRRCRSDLPSQIDAALEVVGQRAGVILDFRANGGGGFDHDAVLGRFVPKGHALQFAKRIESAGAKPYGGPVVVIVDAGVRSAGETGSGMFKEDGRAYMIGESPTAGMSSSKTTIELPSRLFSLYVSIASNKRRFNGGLGLEGIGAVPHESVSYDPDELAAGVDTLIRRAEELLADFPKKEVPYDPEDFDWSPPATDEESEQD